MTPSLKEKCQYYRNGSGPVKVNSEQCRRFQREKKSPCVEHCQHYQTPDKVIAAMLDAEQDAPTPTPAPPPAAAQEPRSCPQEDCFYYRSNGKYIKVGSELCQKCHQREKRENCRTCKHNQIRKDTLEAAASGAPAPVIQAAPSVPVLQEKTIMNQHVPSLIGVQNELYKQLQRLTCLKGKDEIDLEVKRSHAVTGLCQTMINNAGLVLNAHLRIAASNATTTMPSLVTHEDPIGREVAHDA